jgi:rod shape-determining protein MreC
LTSDSAFRVGTRVAGSQQIGILSGQGTNKAVLQLLDNQTTLKVGDVILARGSQNNRPFVPGVPIGEVTSVDNAAGAVTQTADVKLYANFSALSVVAVVVGSPKSDPRDASCAESSCTHSGSNCDNLRHTFRIAKAINVC